MRNKLSSQASDRDASRPDETLTPTAQTVEDAVWELAAALTAIRTETMSVQDERRWRIFASFIVAAGRELEAATRIVPHPLPDLDGFLDQLKIHV